MRRVVGCQLENFLPICRSVTTRQLTETLHFRLQNEGFGSGLKNSADSTEINDCMSVPLHAMLRNIFGKCCTSGATTLASQAMLLILGDNGLRHGNFPDLMAEWFWIRTFQFRPALAAFCRSRWNDLIAISGGDQFSLLLGMSGLSTSFPSRLLTWRNRLGVRMFCSWWNR